MLRSSWLHEIWRQKERGLICIGETFVTEREFKYLMEVVSGLEEMGSVDTLNLSERDILWEVLWHCYNNKSVDDCVRRIEVRSALRINWF